MTRAQYLQATAALHDLQGWLADAGDALRVFVVKAIALLALFNLLRWALMPGAGI
jgi:hypothetical protein